MTGVLALALRLRALSHGTVPSSVPMGHGPVQGVTGTVGTVRTNGTPGTTGTSGTSGTRIADTFREDTATAVTVGASDQLEADRDVWLPEDWQVYFDERAGIAEFDGGLARAEAEARAFECYVVEWINRSFVPSEPDRCCECGQEDDVSDPLLPHGVEALGHVWLHSRCWSRHCDRRRAEAVAALCAMGVG